MIISFLSLIFPIFSFYNTENIANPELFPENNFPIIKMNENPDEKNIFILSGRLAEENPLENMKNLASWWRSDKIFECENFSVFGLDSDISVVENPKSQFFFSENMATGDFYDCEGENIAKYDFVEFGDGEKFLQKIIFDENFYFSETCEWKHEKFEKYFSWKNGEKIPWNQENCDKIFKKYQILTAK